MLERGQFKVVHLFLRTGTLSVWVVVEIYRPDPHSSEIDLGLVPGGRVKLVKSATINVCNPTTR